MCLLYCFSNPNIHFLMRFFSSSSLVSVCQVPHRKYLALSDEKCSANLFSGHFYVKCAHDSAWRNLVWRDPSIFSCLPGALFCHLLLSSLIISLSSDACPLTFKNTQIIYPPKETLKSLHWFQSLFKILLYIKVVYSCPFHIFTLPIPYTVRGSSAWQFPGLAVIQDRG